MNTNELTTLIGECLKEIEDHGFFLKLELVLRQQQAEIEALKAENERLFASMLDMALDSELKDLKYGKTREK